MTKMLMIIMLVSVGGAPKVENTPTYEGLRRHHHVFGNAILRLESGLNRVAGEQVAFVTLVSLHRLKRSPKWEEDEPYPPLSPREARRLANIVCDQILPYGYTPPVEPVRAPLPGEAVSAAQFASIELVQLDGPYWFWKVNYSWIGPLGIEFAVGLPIAVLMDGTVLRPRAVPRFQLPADYPSYQRQRVLNKRIKERIRREKEKEEQPSHP